MQVRKDVPCYKCFLTCTKCPWKHLAENKIWGSWTSNRTSTNFTQDDITAHIKQRWKQFWTDIREIFRSWSQKKFFKHALWMLACFALFSLFAAICAQVFSIGAGHHQLSFKMRSWVCLGIGLLHCHTLQTPTISLCECFFSRVCTRNTNNWRSRGNSSKAFTVCKCTHQEQVRLGHREQCVFVFLHTWKRTNSYLCLFHKLQICDSDNFQPPHKKIPSSQIVYNLSGINVENYLVATANDFIRNRWIQPVFASA